MSMSVWQEKPNRENATASRRLRLTVVSFKTNAAASTCSAYLSLIMKFAHLLLPVFLFAINFQPAAFAAPRQFDGVAQFMKIEPPRLNLSNGQFTLEWVLQTSSDAQSSLLGVFDEGKNQGISLDLNTNEQDRHTPGLTRFFLRDLAGTGQSSIAGIFSDEDANLYDGKLHHLVFIYDSKAATQFAALRVFLDGAPLSLSFASQFSGVPQRFGSFNFEPTLAARNSRGTLTNFAALTLNKFTFTPRILTPEILVAHTRAAGIKPRMVPTYQLDKLRTVAPADKAAFDKRAREFLSFVVENRDNPMETVWGKYRDFDMYALACLALGEHDADARRLLTETLDMIDHNFAVERRPRGDKWHLADFAMEPLLRAYFQYRPTHFPNDPVWNRLEKTAQNFLFHYGDLSENHNLLHLSLRYLTGQTWPNATLNDGRKASIHKEEADAQIRQWMNDWVRRGSGEWGADIYYNINLLALLNLYDFAEDNSMRVAAQGMLDLFALDEALDSYAGAAVGAARRGYAVYRMEVQQSPSRPLQYLWFDTKVQQPFNLNFIGGAIQAATSKYLPPPAIRWIANSRAPQENNTTHARGLWPVDGLQTIGKHTLRLAGAMQSTMLSPGGGGRYTEHVWQITMNETALIFANHPTLGTGTAFGGGRKTVAETLALYDTPRPHNVPITKGAWYWAYANVPPGHQGDVRPGYWQGNSAGPRSFGTKDLSFLIFDIPADNPLPFAHVYLPRAEFDEVREIDNWIYLRQGNGYAALWLPTGYEPTTSGLWANVELKLRNPQTAIFSIIGDKARDKDFEAFIARCKYLQPQWDAQNLTLSALRARDGERISVSYANGPSQNGQTIDARGPRFQTPWGAMKLGQRTLQLKTPAGEYRLDLRAALR